MKTSINSAPAAIETSNPAKNYWPPNTFSTVKSSFSLCQRIEFILEKLKAEPWLPNNLRLSIANASTRILSEHLKGTLSSDRARKLVEVLSDTTFPYQELTLSSATLCQIRTLDLEMNEQLHSRFVNIEDEATKAGIAN